VDRNASTAKIGSAIILIPITQRLRAMSTDSEDAGASSTRPVSYHELHERNDKPRLQLYKWHRERVVRLYPGRTGPAFDGLVLWTLFNLENLYCADDVLQDEFEKAEFNGWKAKSTPAADMKAFFEGIYGSWMERAKVELPQEIQSDPRFAFAVRCLSWSKISPDEFNFKHGFSDYLSRFKMPEPESKINSEEFVLETLEFYQSRYVSRLTVQDALEIIIDVGRLFDLAKGEIKA